MRKILYSNFRQLSESMVENRNVVSVGEPALAWQQTSEERRAGRKRRGLSLGGISGYISGNKKMCHLWERTISHLDFPLTERKKLNTWQVNTVHISGSTPEQVDMAPSQEAPQNKRTRYHLRKRPRTDFAARFQASLSEQKHCSISTASSACRFLKMRCTMCLCHKLPPHRFLACTLLTDAAGSLEPPTIITVTLTFLLLKLWIH